MQLMNELESWLDVIGYEGLYRISNSGKVKTLHPGKKRYGSILKHGVNSKGYAMVVLCNNGNKKNVELHRLVATAFINNANNKPAVNHIDGNPLNNHVSNLEWCTIAENNKHARSMGRYGGNRKLTNNKVAAIRLLLSLGLHPKRIARLFNT